MKKYIGWAAIALIIIAAGVLLAIFKNDPHPLPISSQDKIESWDFAGAYKGKVDLEQRAKDEIKRLKDLIGSGTYTDYEIYISIAAQYELLGDGKQAYKYLGEAIRVDSENTGLAWHNLGNVLARLGAYNTARFALDKAVEAQPYPAYQMSRLDFLQRYFPDDKEAIEKARKELEGK